MGDSLCLYEKFIQEIEQFYDQYSYQLGWRFLNCSKKVLKANPVIAFITLNPAGNAKPMDQPSGSCEHGHSYNTETWGTSLPGQSPLQIQIQCLFRKLEKFISIENYDHSLLEESL